VRGWPKSAAAWDELCKFRWLPAWRIAGLTRLYSSHCCGRDAGYSKDIENSFEVVGDGGEADLCGGLDDPSPSHPAKAIASLPRTEDLSTRALTRWIGWFQA
jgi:hypothetical protein